MPLQISQKRGSRLSFHYRKTEEKNMAPHMSADAGLVVASALFTGAAHCTLRHIWGRIMAYLRSRIKKIVFFIGLCDRNSNISPLTLQKDDCKTKKRKGLKMRFIGKCQSSVYGNRAVAGMIWVLAGVIWHMNILGAAMGSACFKIAFFSFFSADMDFQHLFKMIKHLIGSLLA